MKGISIEEDINGVNVSFNDTIVNFDVNSLNIEKLKTIEKGAIFALLNHMQAHFLDLPFIKLDKSLK